MPTTAATVFWRTRPRMANPLKVDYSYAGFVNIAAFSKTNVEKGIIFSGINGDGQKVRVIVGAVSRTAKGRK